MAYADWKLDTPKRMAIVKLDDYSTTHSTGGVVVEISNWHFEGSGRTSPCTNGYENDNGTVKSGYLAIESATAQVNWIYTDKTHQLVDSNISS